MAIVTFVAFSIIISKAGYSRGWVLIPLTPLALWVVTLAEAKIQLHTYVIFWALAPFYPHTISVLLDVDKIAIFASWLFLLLFAFSSWPAKTPSTPAVAAATSHVQRSGADVANADPRSTSRYPMPKGPGFGAVGFVAGPNATTHEEASTVTTKPRGNQLATFCARCGASIPGNRALAHNCPNAGQPSKFCRYCGKSIPDGSASCPSCHQEA
jgi:hypothetical protein